MKKILIVGGVAGGASCAARLRRLDEEAQITIFEKGDYVSFANCGLPYHVSGVIEKKSSLLMMTPELLKSRFNIDVKVHNEVTAIDRENKKITVKDLTTGKETAESYDILVLATGSSPLKPVLPGIDSSRIHTIWNIGNAAEIRKAIEEDGVENVCVIGGGFIGMEMTENLVKGGKNVTVCEAADQIMGNLDKEMAMIVEKTLKANGVELITADPVVSFTDHKGGITVNLSSGKTVDCQLVILSIGVKPNSTLAEKAGLKLNSRGGIIVDRQFRTSDPAIMAVGDVIEVEDFIDKEATMIPLAGPANKQGRMAAGIIAGSADEYQGSQGTSIARIFDICAASSGHNEKQLQKKGLVRGKDYQTITFSANSHATYYPGATPMMIKVLFDQNDHRILGCQIVGNDGVDKRIDVIATAMRLSAPVTALKDLDLSYAPPFSSAKDPVNMAGFIAENVINGLAEFAPYNELETNSEAICIDVREPGEVERFSIPNAINIPLGSLREHLNEFDPSRHYVIMCAAGVRAHTASRILQLNGFTDVVIYPGGARFYRLTH